jgi:hypothetical protein
MPNCPWPAGGRRRRSELDAAAARARAGVRPHAASRAGYLRPSPTASERLTNAPGFGEALTGTVAHRDPEAGLATRAPSRRSRRRPRRGAPAAARRPRRCITDAWHQVDARRLAVAAAVARVEAARLGATTARERFAAGTATQLDVTLAQRDQLAAELTLVSTRAELAADRALLRLAAGREVAP